MTQVRPIRNDDKRPPSEVVVNADESDVSLEESDPHDPSGLGNWAGAGDPLTGNSPRATLFESEEVVALDLEEESRNRAIDRWLETLTGGPPAIAPVDDDGSGESGTSHHDADRSARWRPDPDQFRPSPVRPDANPTAGESGKSRYSKFFFLFVVVVVALVGMFARLTVFAPDGPVAPRALSLTDGSSACPAEAPRRIVRRYEKQTQTEEWRGPAADERKARTRFVDNEAKSFLVRPEESPVVTDMMIEGTRFVASASGGWDEVVPDPSKLAAQFMLPFEDRFGEAESLNRSTIDGEALCFYSKMLGRVVTPDGAEVSNAQLELYVDPFGGYRRVRLRGDRRADAGPTVTDPSTGSMESLPMTPAPSTTEPSAKPDGKVLTYMLTLDLAEVPAFAPQRPTKTAASF